METTSPSEREELIGDIRYLWDPWDDRPEKLADALIAAGYRKESVREVTDEAVRFVADPAQITALNPLGIVAVGKGQHG